MKRLAVAGSVAALVGVVAVPGAAAGELEDYLRSAATSSYSGRQIVVTAWGDHTSFGSYQVAQGPGMTMVHGRDYEMRTGGGKVSATGGDSFHGLALDHWADWRLHERYSMGEQLAVTPLGRPGTSVDIMEAGVVRARLVFDEETAAPIRAEWFDGSGTIYRLSVLVDFFPGGPDAAAAVEGDGGDMTYPLSAAAPDTDLPANAAGYWRADAYDGPGLATHIFYTDGLFSFSVFELPERARSAPFADAAKMKVDGNTYRILVEPGAVWVYWSAPDRSYVLVGDLPPDHLERVLIDLPDPGRRNIFVRMWRNFFG